MHPVIPVHNRTAMNAFEVDGKQVPARSDVLVVFPAAHYMAENFKDPDRFDIERFAPPRNEHRKRGAYHPFGVGRTPAWVRDSANLRWLRISC